MSPIVAFLSLVVSMLILDGFWLYFAGSRLYPKFIGHLLNKDSKGNLKANWLAGGIFYVMYTLLIFVLVVNPNLTNPSLVNVFLQGALTGLLAYGTYDLTNQATLKDWPWKVTIIDMIWGTMLTGVVSLIAVSLG